MDYQSGYAHYLTEEKRASSNTLSSYLRDVNQYLHWLAGEKLLPEQGVNVPPRLGLSQAQGQTAHRQTSSLFSGVAAFFVVHFPYDSIPKEVIR